MQTPDQDVIIKETTSLGMLLIKRVPKALAKDICLHNHYSHKWNGGFGIYSYGIFRADDPNNCLGVAAFGYMKNTRAKIFTHPNPKAWMIELNRMWISDELGHNAETVLIAASIKLLRRTDPNVVAIQSFADGRLGCGTIYKAANFKYYGYHLSIFLRCKRSGEGIHQQILTDSKSPSGFLRANMRFLLGDFEIFRVKTYRYIYPLCKHFKFKTSELPYPAYEKGEQPYEWNRDRAQIKTRMVELLANVA